MSSSCSSQPFDHVCCQGTAFDCFELNAPPGVRRPYNKLEELYKTWWESALQLPLPNKLWPPDWRRDLPLPVQGLSFSVKDRDTACLTIWGPLTCVAATLFVGLWLFLIFYPLSSAVWYNVFLFATPIVLSMGQELQSFNITLGHKNVLDFADAFFPHSSGLALFKYHHTRQTASHMGIRQINLLALSNLLIIANLVSTDGQRQALQTSVAVIFSAVTAAFQVSTVKDRTASEFYASKVIHQIHDFFEKEGFHPKGPAYQNQDKTA